MNYRAVLFDFGGVFTSSPFHAVNNFASKNDIDVQTFANTIFGQYGVDGDHPWHQVERGEISLETARELILELGKEQGFEADIYSVFAVMGEDGGGPRQQLADYAIELADRGLITACVTNNIKEFGDGWKSMFDTGRMFNHIIDSSHEGVRKPEARIFEIALERASVDAAEALFLDDFAGNVEAAEQLGINSILVTADEQKTLADLKATLGV